MQTVRLELTIAEINQILGALGDKPFAQVYQLVQKIRQQAESELNPAAQDAGTPLQEEV
jgi:hypothetical protein